MQIGQKGDLQEWLEDWGQKEKSHRHISNLYGLFPGQPDLGSAGRRSSPRAPRSSSSSGGFPGNGWASAWKMACWARLLDADKAMDNFTYAMKHYTTTACSRSAPTPCRWTARSG